MEKNIEALAQIGEWVMLEKLNDALNGLTKELAFRTQDLRHEWETGFKKMAELYTKIKDEAVNLGLDVSDYECEFSKLSKRYSEIAKKDLIIV
jgi:hypothetical protein